MYLFLADLRFSRWVVGSGVRGLQESEFRHGNVRQSRLTS